MIRWHQNRRWRALVAAAGVFGGTLIGASAAQAQTAAAGTGAAPAAASGSTGATGGTTGTMATPGGATGTGSVVTGATGLGSVTRFGTGVRTATGVRFSTGGRLSGLRNDGLAGFGDATAGTALDADLSQQRGDRSQLRGDAQSAINNGNVQTLDAIRALTDNASAPADDAVNFPEGGTNAELDFVQGFNVDGRPGGAVPADPGVSLNEFDSGGFVPNRLDSGGFSPSEFGTGGFSPGGLGGETGSTRAGRGTASRTRSAGFAGRRSATGRSFPGTGTSLFSGRGPSVRSSGVSPNGNAGGTTGDGTAASNGGATNQTGGSNGGTVNQTGGSGTSLFGGRLNP